MGTVAETSGSVAGGQKLGTDANVAARALRRALSKLNPAYLRKRRALLVLEIAAVAATCVLVKDLVGRSLSSSFDFAVTVLIWGALYCSTFLESLAESRAKAHADALRIARGELMARRVSGHSFESVPASRLAQGDTVIVEAGELIPADGEIVDGIATVDESVITGESAPVIRESGHGLNAVSAGTRVLSDGLTIRVTYPPEESLLDRMARAVEGVERQKTPDEIKKSRMLATFTVAAVAAVVILAPFGIYTVLGLGNLSVAAVLSGLTVSLLPLSISALLPVIGVAGLDRVLRHRVLATHPSAVENAAHVDLVLLDKTGTITEGNREATEFIALPGVSEQDLARAVHLSSYSDETPEGRSALRLSRERYGIDHVEMEGAQFLPFSAYTRMSGVDVGSSMVRKGATAAIADFVRSQGGMVPEQYERTSEAIARTGGTPLGVADGSRLLGIIHLRDIVKHGLKDRISQLREMGIRPVMITGDNPITAEAIARETGFEEFVPQATPADKLAYIKREQAAGLRVAMTGDGINDAPALAQADVGLAMYSGATAAKEAGNLVDLDSDPTKLLEITQIARDMRVTRSALAAFSLAKCVSNFVLFLAIIVPACYPALRRYAIFPPSTLPATIVSALICSIFFLFVMFPIALFGLGSYAKKSTSYALFLAVTGLTLPIPSIWFCNSILAALHVSFS
jgi:potassium-transporting ATPase ATP-binding subunit